MGPMFRDFQKTDPKQRHIPVCLICEYPPPPGVYSHFFHKKFVNRFLNSLNGSFWPESLSEARSMEAHGHGILLPRLKLVEMGWKCEIWPHFKSWSSIIKLEPNLGHRCNMETFACGQGGWKITYQGQSQTVIVHPGLQQRSLVSLRLIARAENRDRTIYMHDMGPLLFFLIFPQSYLIFPKITAKFML